MIQGLNGSSKSFYEQLQDALIEKKVKGIKVSSIYHKEGGVLSANREYLEVRRGKFVFHICAAPFGNGFFVSWWLGEKPAWLLWLMYQIPIIGRFAWAFNPAFTYYKIDTAMMFQSLTHNAVLQVVDGLTQEHGLRGLPDIERKPHVRDLLTA
jgi:hypothetical protein